MNRYKYTVTKEFRSTAPVMNRGVVEASNPATASARAIKDAGTERGWVSLVVVLERCDDEQGDETAEKADDPAAAEEESREDGQEGR